MFKVIIAGVRGNQLEHLRQRLPSEIDLHGCELRQILRVRSMRADLVVCTRFIAHKHQWHLEVVAGCPVVWCQGGIGTWAATIRDFLESARAIRHADRLGRAC